MSKAMKIVVLDRPAEAAKWEGNGQVRHYFKQWAILEVDGLPTAFEFSSDEVLPVGEAVLSPKSFGVQNGRLTLARPTLIPVARVAAVAPAASKQA
jgi:hypothetical protein